MTQMEYMKNLDECLQSLAPARKAEILEDIAGYFREGIQEGYSEADLAQRLGPPEILAGEYGAQVNEHNARESGTASSAASSLFGSLSSLLGSVLRGTTDTYEPYQAHWDIPFSAGHKLTITTNNVDIVTDVYDGDMLSIDFDGKRAAYQDGTYPEIAVEQESEDTTCIRQEDGASGATMLGFRLTTSALSGTLTLRIPRQELESLIIKTTSGDQKINGIHTSQATLSASSGDITIADLVCLTKSSIQTSSGDIRVSKLLVPELSVQSSSGDIALQDGHATTLNSNSKSGDMTLHDLRLCTANAASSSGDVEILRIFVERDANVSASSGDLTLDDLEVGGSATLHTSSGSIRGHRLAFDTLNVSTASGGTSLKQVQVHGIKAQSASGGCSIQCLTPTNIQAHSASGSVNFYVPVDMGFTYRTHTHSGSTAIRFPAIPDREQGRQEKTGTVGDGAQHVNIETSSGSISVRPLRDE